MPFYLKPPDEALMRFVGRMTVCSEMQEAFTRDAFEANFPKHHARSAFSDETRKRLAQFLKNEDMCKAMETINRGLHDFGVKAGCPSVVYDKKPAVFWRNLLSSLLILGVFGAMTVRSGFDPVMILGIVPAVVLLVYAIRYDWL